MTTQKPKELAKLINKIIKARKIQKDRIENENLEYQLETEHTQRKQKPFIEAVNRVDESLAKSNRNTIAAIENQQQHMQHLQDMVKHSTKEITSKLPLPLSSPLALPETESSKKKPKDLPIERWPQAFFKNNRLSAKTTKLEAKMNGTIGDFGFIDIDDLFNYARINMKLGPDQEPFEVDPKNVTSGLVALLLLPFEDMEKANIKPSDKDIQIYTAIMSKAGCRSSKANRKYIRYLPYIEEVDPNLNYVELLKTISELHRRKTLEERKAIAHAKLNLNKPNDSDDDDDNEVSGKGLLLYKDSSDLEDKLKICLGSLQAGNTSLKVKNDCRILLDKLLELKEILPSIHNRLYKKFQL